MRRRNALFTVGAFICAVGVNLKTAKTLGIAIPQSIMLRADKVIE